MPCSGSAIFKAAEFVMCVVCLVYKRVTDNEAIRVFYHLEKISREWPLLNNVTWDENGALLADVTFGGFALVALGLLVGAVAGELRRARRLVCFYQALGCIMFLVVGGLCLAAIDSVPNHLVDNAIVLGVLSILTGLLFLLDLALTGNQRVTSPQDKKPLKMEAKKPPEGKKPEEGKKDKKKDPADDSKTKKNLGNGALKELRSSIKRKKTVEDLDGRGVVVEKNEKNVEFETVKLEDGLKDKEKIEETTKIIERSTFDPDRDELDRSHERNGLERSGYDMSPNEYRQYGRRRMDNRGFPRTDSADSGRYSSEQRFRGEFLEAERSRWGESERHERHASLLEGTYDPRRSRPSSMMELELDEHYLRPQDYYIEKRTGVREEGRLRERERVAASKYDYSDDDFQSQLPSVSFLVSERARKVLPSVKASPLERLQELTVSPGAGGAKPRYYFSSSRDPASGSSAPPSPQQPPEPPLPRTPGYVLHTAAAWGDPDKTPVTVSDRIQHWFRSRPPGKAP